MNKKLMKSSLRALLGVTALLCTNALPVQAASAPSVEELWAVIQMQQKEIEQLKAQQKSTDQKVEDATQKVQATSETVEQTAQAVEQVQKTASKPSWVDKTKVGGYGELIYNHLDSKNQIDLRRVVLYLGHEFTNRIRFASEIEFEHAVASKEDDGEVAVEQAHLDFDLTDKATLGAGLFLIPAGIINETHEPTTFYGVERNIVETNIIPTTWREAGVDLYGEFAPGWHYDLALTSGLKTPIAGAGADAYLIGEGPQEGVEATANNPAYTGRIKWTGMPGVELAATLQYQDDLTQGAGDPGTASSATLFETHAVVTRGPFGLRALYARWDLDGPGPKAIGRDKQAGWYIEPSYKILSKLGLFARYSESDNNAGSNNLLDTEIREAAAGFNYWPYEDVVFKFDVQQQSGGSNDDGFNLGIGYQF